MSLETDLFKRMACDMAKLEPFGFVKQKDGYVYQTQLVKDDMQVRIHVDQYGKVSGKVIDLFSGEEYIAVHLPNQKGSYVAEIRSAYLTVLAQIAEACFHSVPFLLPQSNRIAEKISEKYHIRCEFPFAKYPHYGAWYHPQNRKWFCIIMNLDRSVITNETGECEILDLKVMPEDIPALIDQDGIYEGYHMSKKSWISVMLDDTLKDADILKLVDKSYALTSAGTCRQGIKEWIIPANPDYFDLDHAFQQTDEIHWKQTAKMQIGDLVYMYYGAPYSQIRYLCRVTEVEIPADIYGKVRIRKMMKIRKLYQFKGDKIDRRMLHKFGVVSVRGPRFIPEELKEEIAKIYPESIEAEKEKRK